MFGVVLKRIDLVFALRAQQARIKHRGRRDRGGLAIRRRRGTALSNAGPEIVAVGIATDAAAVFFAKDCAVEAIEHFFQGILFHAARRAGGRAAWGARLAAARGRRTTHWRRAAYRLAAGHRAAFRLASWSRATYRLATGRDGAQRRLTTRSPPVLRQGDELRQRGARRPRRIGHGDGDRQGGHQQYGRAKRQSHRAVPPWIEIRLPSE